MTINMRTMITTLAILRKLAPVRANHVGIVVDDDTIDEAVFFPFFFRPEFIQGAHKDGIAGMAFHAVTHGTVGRKDIMGDQQAVVHFRMAFDTTYRFEMQFLIGKPVMFRDDITEVTTGEESEFFLVAVTVQTDVIGGHDDIRHIFRFPGQKFITVGIMTIPAGEISVCFGIMHRLLALCIDLLKLVLCKFFIISMAVQACPVIGEPEFKSVGEGLVLIGMAIEDS